MNYTLDVNAAGNRSGFWSQRINQEHRLVYSIEDEIVTVIVVSAKGHYE
ncbi:hypothetical protein FACS189427_13060 [Planctomycetales bacterium]|nr:hypothetical protein FACS189427_13060 [Planctomycetales bacterium]